MRGFQDRLAGEGLGALRAAHVEVIQANLGAECNQRCRHCHVAAGPGRREAMSREVLAGIIEIGRRFDVQSLDVTGGAPELHPEFEWFVAAGADAFPSVTVRTNLTAFLDGRHRRLPRFLRRLGVGVIASLPCYTRANVDSVRGAGVFARSIEGLRLLNDAGYGRGEPPELVLAHNPAGPSLPGPAAELEADYRRELAEGCGVAFDRLITLANVPVGRFLAELRAAGGEAEYLELLEAAFNPATVPELMCRSFVSVGWDGRLYDCDFNRALGLEAAAGRSRDVRTFDPSELAQRPIRTGPHCYACTAGQGSSCLGSLA
jgi:radical SAM/Cys-rich protein